jgi:hypothetical protein
MSDSWAAVQDELDGVPEAVERPMDLRAEPTPAAAQRRSP